MVVFGQKWLYSGKVVVFGQSGRIREKRLYSGTVIVFGQSSCIQKRWMSLSKSGCNRKKVALFGQK